MIGSPSNDDGSLWGQVLAGNAGAFARLFDRYCDVVYNAVYRRTGSWDAAEEAVAVVFLEAWRQRDRIVLHHGSLRPWLLGVAANVAKRWWRSNERTGRALERVQLVDGPDHATDVVERIDDQCQLQQVLHRISDLSEAHRDVLLLWAWEELTYEEISVALDVPAGTVRSRLNRARRALAAVPGGTGIPHRASHCDVRRPDERCAAVDGCEGELR